MVVKTGRFGDLEISDTDQIEIPQGVLGFAGFTKFCLVDPGDDTFILWLQSMEQPDLAFPVLEPKIFRANYTVRLSAAELRELKLDNVNQSAVFCVLTIPSDVTQMTANLKAPIVINLKEQVAKQVVLQENDYGIKVAIFKELRQHLVTLQSTRRGAEQQAAVAEEAATDFSAVSVRDIPPSLTVKGLQA